MTKKSIPLIYEQIREVGMFELGKVLSKYNGRAYTPKGFRRLMVNIRIENIRNIAAEFGTIDLIECAQKNGWVKVNRNNKQRQIIICAPV